VRHVSREGPGDAMVRLASGEVHSLSVLQVATELRARGMDGVCVSGRTARADCSKAAAKEHAPEQANIVAPWGQRRSLKGDG
jgi:hypothetical protein